MTRIFDRFIGVVGSRAGDDRHPACRDLDGDLDHAFVLLRRDRRRFTCRTYWNEAVATLFDLPIYEFSESFLIDAPVLHRRDQSRKRTLELHGLVSGKNLATMRWLESLGSAQGHGYAEH